MATARKEQTISNVFRRIFVFMGLVCGEFFSPSSSLQNRRQKFQDFFRRRPNRSRSYSILSGAATTDTIFSKRASPRRSSHFGLNFARLPGSGTLVENRLT